MTNSHCQPLFCLAGSFGDHYGSTLANRIRGRGLPRDGARELGMGHYTPVSQAVSRLQRKPGRKLPRLKRLLLEAEVEYG